jgi:Tfp pilus tip-associated adhesin PilY1
VFTSSGNAHSGAPLKWSNLTTGQRADLTNDSSIVDYLRGDDGKEVSKGGGHDRLPTTSSSGQASYKTFRSNAGPLDDMRKTIFVAPNDGMLHAFNSTDMGFVLSYPHIVRMRSDKWAVIFGNGYESASGEAVLYIRDAETGASIKEFAVGPAGGNGLSQPTLHPERTARSHRHRCGRFEGQPLEIRRQRDHRVGLDHLERREHPILHGHRAERRSAADQSA